MTTCSAHGPHGPSWHGSAHAWPHSRGLPQTAPHVWTGSVQLVRERAPGRRARTADPHGQRVTFSGAFGHGGAGSCEWAWHEEVHGWMPHANDDGQGSPHE